MSVVRLRRGLDRALEGFLALLLAGMALNVLWQVATRFLLGDPSSVTEELARFGLVWLGILGASYGFGRRVHLAVAVLPERLPERPRLIAEILAEAFVALFALTVLGFGGARLVAVTLSLGQTSAALGAPLGAVYAVLPIGAGIVLFYAGAEIALRVQRLRGR